jgi:transmembrane sensor
MTPRMAQLAKNVPRPLRADAAAWVAAMHAPSADTQLDAKLQQWMAQSPRHAAAFEFAAEAWRISADPVAAIPGRSSLVTRSRWRRRIGGPAFAGVAAAYVALLVAIVLLRDNTFKTGPDEQRTLVLNDGTQVSMNANSRLTVQYDDAVRRVTLSSGEALFEVRTNAAKPFVVQVGDRKVVALGTSFMVRREQATGQKFAVALVTGRVAVEPSAWPESPITRSTTQITLMNPGDRLQFADAAVTRDPRSLDAITAWRRGQLIFDDVSLRDAAAEFNRYGAQKIIVGSDAAGNVRVGGVFKIDDPSGFASMIAAAHRLPLSVRNRDIIIGGAAEAAPAP